MLLFFGPFFVPKLVDPYSSGLQNLTPCGGIVNYILQDYDRHQLMYHLVVENMSITKQCKPPPDSLIQAGIILCVQAVAA